MEVSLTQFLFFSLPKWFIRPLAVGLLLVCIVGSARSAGEVKAPPPDHVVIVIEENRAYSQVIAKSIMSKTPAPYINSLANEGALFTNSYGLTHPSQPNYLALFSGSTHGVTDNRCPLSLSGDNLASELRKKGFTFAIYSESMPSVGFEGCYAAHNLYARKHNPVVNWQGRGLPPEINLPFDAFPSDFTKLPTVSIVVPNQVNDMHDGQIPWDAIAHGDRWLKDKLDPFVRWARSNNSLLIVTWDEDDNSSNNQIATIFVGPMVKPGRYGQRIDHYNVLQTITEMYGLPALGASARAKPIVDIWKRYDSPR
jgi:acid phosphatase